MKIKLTFLFFICLQTVLLAQDPTPAPVMEGGRCINCPKPPTNIVINYNKKGNPTTVLNGNENIATSYSATACGLNYIHASFNLNQRAFSFGTGITQPAPFTISGIPVCGKIFKAFLYSSCESDGSTVINASVTNPLGGNSIFPMSVIGTGNSKCWGRSSSLAFRADITSIISGNGTYFLSGFPASTGAPGDDDVNGASLFIIYTDETQNYTGSIVIADGMFTNVPLPSGFNVPIQTTIAGFNVCGPTSLTSNFLIVDDMQQLASINMQLNSSTANYSLPAASQLPWELITQPGAAATAGQTSAVYGIDATAGADCVGIIAAGMYFRTNCLTCPTQLTVSATSQVCTPSGNATVTTNGGVAPLTYTWSGTAQTTSVVTNLSPGTHTVRVADANSCKTKTTTINITRPTTVTVNNATLCIGYTNTLIASSNNTYTWSPATGLSTVSGPSVIAQPTITTVYTVTSTNSLNCISTNTAQVFVSPTQTISVANPTACLGGDLHLLANTTFTGNSYNWQGPAYSSALQNPTVTAVTMASAGNYSLTVISIAGCTSQAVAVASIMSLPSLTITSSAPICSGENLSILATGAVNYTWASPGYNGNLANTTIVNATTLANGIYTLTGAFVNGCQSTITKSLQVKPLPTPTVSYNDPLCTGLTLSLSVSGGNTYTWTGPAGFTSTASNPTVGNTSAANAGTYSVTVSLNSCTITTNTVVVVNPLPTPFAVNNSPKCDQGYVQLTASGAGNYTWTGPGGFSTTAQNVPLSPVQMTNAGVYTLSASDALGCMASTTTTVIILPNPAIVATGTNVCDGSPGTLTVTGGAGYTWAGPNSFASAISNPTVAPVNSISSGIYTVTVSGTNNCISVATASLGTIPLPTVAVTSTAACFGETATLTVSGASTYTWSGPNSYIAQGTVAIVPVSNALSIGIYTVVATSSNTCVDKGTGLLSTIPLPTVTATGTTVCLNEPAVLTSTGDVSTASYLWKGPLSYTDGVQNTTIASANSASPRVYTVIATAFNTCTSSATATLYTIPLPTVVATSSVVCFNYPYVLNAGGAVTYTWTGPTGSGYSSTPTSTAFVSNISGNFIGTYTVVGTGPNSCTNLATAQISTMALPAIAAVGSTVCYGKPTQLLSNGGISGGYSWTGPNNYSSNAQNAFIPIDDNAAIGIYTVVGTALNTCTSSATAQLGYNPLPQPTFIAPQRMCFKSSMTLQGFGAKTYTWTGPYNYFSPHQNVTIPLYNMQQAGTYTLSVLDSLGCANNTTTIIKIDPLPIGHLVSDNVNNFCVPYCSKFGMTSSGITPVVNTSWLLNNRVFPGDTFSYCVTNATDNFAIGSFTDALGCVNTITFSIDAYQSPVADFVFTPDQPAESLDEVIFTNASKGADQVQWNWYFISNKGFISSSENTSYTFSDAGNYQVAMVVVNKWGCADTVVKNILIGSDVKLYVPNAFTPNGDGLNDIFQPKGRGIKKYNLTIFDRWANVVFQTSDFSTGWDGTLRGSSCTDDVYAWKMVITDSNGQIKELAGSVTLAR